MRQPSIEKDEFSKAVRPRFHFIAPHGWMNDPCGPGFDPITNTYHLFYQWNPQGCEWGNMSWGHATSKDLVTWKHSSNTSPALSPDKVYDKEGVFTGCFIPSGPHGEDGMITLFYTSVCHLPIHWSIPYIRGSESLAAAVSKDGGATWDKFEGNPILPEEPESLTVTGWRDPYLSRWESLDRLRGTEDTLYGVISGGIKDKGPAIFLYAIQPDKLFSWDYIGVLTSSTPNFRRSSKWSADFGVNWECGNFMTLRDDLANSSREFIICGSEGGHERPWLMEYLDSVQDSVPRRTVSYSFWFSGSLIKGEDGVSMKIDFDGYLDHGCYYAAGSFYDPNGSRRIVWGWIKEDDLAAKYAKNKGWAGCLALPRELFLQRTPGVVKALKTPLSEITSVYALKETQSSRYVIETLGIRPLTELSQLRKGDPTVVENLALPSGTTEAYLSPVKSARWELETTIEIQEGCTAVGFHVRHTTHMKTSTTINFLPQEEEITVIRSNSSTLSDVNRSKERGAMTLFTQEQGNQLVLEPLTLRIFSDGNTLEVYANERFALSTVIYTSDPAAIYLSMFAQGVDGAATFKRTEFWTQLGTIYEDQ
ncbi:hypothetical protein V2G26_010523 [Clonostachys chloroleuca]